MPLRTSTAISIVVIAILAAALRIFHLDYLSLWNDEIFTHYYYELFGPHFLLTTGLTIEPTPPLYYFMLEAWMRVFGHGAVPMRALSVCASLVALPLVFLLAREVATRKVAIVAALLFALSPMAIYFSQEARVYMLTVVWTSLMLLGIARYLRRGRASHLALYAASAIVAMYSHSTMMFLIAACNVVVIAVLLIARKAGTPATLRGWLAANVVVGVIAVPLLFIMASIGQHGTGLSWIPPFSPRDIAVALSGLVAGIITPLRWPGIELTMLTLIALVAAIAAVRAPRVLLLVTVAIPAVFVVLVCIASLKQPILLPRILCWMTAPLSVLIAWAVTQRSRLAHVVRIVVCVTFAAGLYYQLAEADGAKPPYREVFGQAHDDLMRADSIVLAPYASPLVLDFYAPNVPHVSKWRDRTITGIEEWQVARLGIPHVPLDGVRDDIAAGRDVWVVASSPDAPLMPQLLGQVPPPQRTYLSRCNEPARDGHEPPPCIAIYGWNVKPR
ncbi:glycosyltransferase family 39 protein [Paraburkholderia phosphatilytica]|uniref:glycosyltransferase family 39 protein n=1 Tax=Paraburkholderia phosphatilytica TaxID=2282883 RepID=UPI0013E032A0|nr:glycosyltransferase family 39 protein [Paraburkholderia phosphatilytica]